MTTTAAAGADDSRSYTQLQEENVALRLLLEEAQKFGQHTRACRTISSTGGVCDCWFGKTVQALVESPLLPTQSLEAVCTNCTHKVDYHRGRIPGQKELACCRVDCPCMALMTAVVVKERLS